MNTFLGFLILTFVAGFYFWDKRPSRRFLFYLLASLVLAFAYWQINAVI